MISNFANAVWSFPLTRFFVFIFTLFAILIFTEPALVVALAKQGIKGSLPVLFTTEVYHLCLCFALLYVFIRKFEHSDLSKFGFDTKNAAGHFALGIILGGLLVVLTLVGMMLASAYDFGKLNTAIDLPLSAITLLLAAATEELIFRSYAFNIMEKSWGTIAAVLVSSFCFGFAHMLNEAGGAAVMDKVVFCTFLSFEAGVSLAACYVLTRRLWMPIAAHWAWNFFEGPFFGTHVSGADFGQSLFSPTIQGPTYLTGGLFGPEGSVVCVLLGTASGIGLLWYAKKMNNDFVTLAQARNHSKETQT